MAGVNFFSDLKKHGTKIAKFKERRYIDDLLADADTDQVLTEFYQQMINGICTH